MSSIERERIAQLEAERARMRQAGAEVERDIVTNVAINEHAGRTAAENTALDEKMRADMAESAARSASASANFARTEAQNERATAGNATFVATMATLIALALVAIIGYYAWWQPTHTIDTSTNTVIEKTVQAPPVQTTAPTVNVAPPHVNVNVQNPTPPPNQNNSDDQDLDKQGTGTLDSDKADGTSGPGSGG